MGQALRNRRTTRLNPGAPAYTKRRQEERGGRTLSQIDDIATRNDKPRESTPEEKGRTKLRVATWAACEATGGRDG